MNVLETQWWTLAIPPEWWAESDDDTILVGDRDEVGCIEMSTLQRDSGLFSQNDVARIAQEEAEQPTQWSKVVLGDFKGVTGSFEADDDAVREWFVTDGPLLLYITYSCAMENKGMDDAAVDQLLDTLMTLDDGQD